MEKECAEKFHGLMSDLLKNVLEHGVREIEEVRKQLEDDWDGIVAKTIKENKGAGKSDTDIKFVCLASVLEFALQKIKEHPLKSCATIFFAHEKAAELLGIDFNGKRIAMKWRKIDKDNLPEGIVLAGDLDGRDLDIGVMKICGGRRMPICKNGYHKDEVYPDYYIPIGELFEIEKEN